jgi:hypothetical protein
MADVAGIEQRFWNKVWRCEHRHPCRRCCWPWKGIDLSVNWKPVWQKYAIFVDKALGSASPIPAHRFAYEIHRGVLTFRGRTFYGCHQCGFAPCCNYAHVILGAPSDNSKDRRFHRTHQSVVTFPDGHMWSYREACRTFAAFREAQNYCRVWAGPVARDYWPVLEHMNRRESDWRWRVALNP